MPLDIDNDCICYSSLLEYQYISHPDKPSPQVHRSSTVTVTERASVSSRTSFLLSRPSLLEREYRSSAFVSSRSLPSQSQSRRVSNSSPLDQLTEEIWQLRPKNDRLVAEKNELLQINAQLMTETELLSQQVFEEANKLVATERRINAELQREIDVLRAKGVQ